MSHLLQLNIRPASTIIPASQGMQLIYVLIEIIPASARQGAPTPVHCCLVVDWSPSMRVPIADDATFRELMRRGLAREVVLDGLPVWQLSEAIPPELKQRIASPADWTIRAVGSAAERLNAGDLISLVVFGSEARALLRRQPGTDQRAVSAALSHLYTTNLGPATRIAQGLELGLQLIREERSAGRAERLLLLTDGFTEDTQRCIELAAAAAVDGVPITTIGLGIEFQEMLLMEIADRSGGRAAFIANPAEIPPLLDRELQRSSRTIARRMRLELRLSEGVELRRLYRVRPTLAELPRTIIRDRSGDLPLGDLELPYSQALLFEILVPPRQAGRYRLVRATLRAHDSTDSPLPPLSSDLVMDYVQGGQPDENPEFTALLARISAFRLQTRALESAASGDIEGATRQLRAAVTRLIEIGETDLADVAESEAQRLAATGQFSAASTKQLRYATRRLTAEEDDRTGTGGN